MADVLYWPTIDLLLWGLASTYFRSVAPQVPEIVLIIISGILFWRIVWHGQFEVTVNLLQEIWDKNLINLFVSPLRFSEWVVSFVVMGIIKAAFTFSFAVVMAYILYRIEIFFYGLYLIPFILLLILSGWWIGFIIASLLLRFGTKVQNFAWSIPVLLSPFSTIYYPLSILPSWAQKISLMLPTTYIFEGVREVIQFGTLDPAKVYMSLILNIVYLALSLMLLRRSFDRALVKGLVKIY